MKRALIATLAAALAACSGSSGSTTTTGTASGATTGQTAATTTGTHGATTSSSSNATGATGTTSGAVSGTTTGANGSAAGSTTATGTAGNSTTSASGTATATTSGSAAGSSTGSTTGGLQNTVLLVDNDGYVGDGSGTDATVLSAYQGYLNGAGITAYDQISIAIDGSQSWGASAIPTTTQLAPYHTVIWITADNSLQIDGSSDAPLSTDQEASLASWLQGGGKTLVLISEYLIGSLQTAQNVPSDTAWDTPLTDPLFATYLPLAGSDDYPAYNNGSGCVPITNEMTGGASGVEVTGGSAVSSTFGTTNWLVSPDDVLTANIPAFSVQTLNPNGGIDVLATIQSEEPGGGACNSTNSASAVTIGKKLAGGTTSNVVFVAFEPYNISGTPAAQTFMTGLLQTYAGLP